MSDDGSGGHHLPPSYFVQAGDTVSPVQHNPPFEDVSAALTNRIHRDGRTAWTGNQNANGKRLTNLANGVGPQDAATVNQAVAASTPIGSMVFYGGATAPTNWVFCFGQAISRTTYATLFARFGTTYGVGDGSTTFNLPDCRGRSPFGKDDMGGTAANRITTAGAGFDGKILGASGGSQTHTLVTAELPVHTHAGATVSAGAHAHTASSASAGSHAHTASTAAGGFHNHTGGTAGAGAHAHSYAEPVEQVYGISSGGGQRMVVRGAATTSSVGDHAHTFSTDGAGNHTHAVTVDAGGAHTHGVTVDANGAHTHGVTIANAGSGSPHMNMPPANIFNMIVRVI